MKMNREDGQRSGKSGKKKDPEIKKDPNRRRRFIIPLPTV